MNEKEKFIRETLVKELDKLDPSAKAKWGAMNVLQMIEHLSDSVRGASGKTPKKIILTPEQVEKARAFMLSDKPFKENTKNQELPEIPPKVRSHDKKEAIDELQSELNYFFLIFERNPGWTVTNPFFGELNYQEWIHLLHKHTTHHLKQFGWNEAG